MARAGSTRRWPAVDQRFAELGVPTLVGVGVAVLAIGVAGVVLGTAGTTPGPTDMTVALSLTFTPLGVFVLRRLPGHPLGRLMTLAGVSATIAAVAVAWSAYLPLAWLSQWAWWVPVAVIPVLVLLVPDGVLPSPRWRWLLVVLLAGGAITAAALAGAALFEPRTLLSTGTQATSPAARALLVVAACAIAVTIVGTAGVLVALVRRWRAAATLERGQLACLLPSAGLLIVGVALDAADVPYGWLPAVVSFPLGLTLAVLRYQLHDLDLYIHRGAVWLVLTASAVVVYAVVVTALDATLTGLSRTTASLLAAGAVAALLQPAQRLVQRAVTRLLYGRRDEPYAVITELGRHLGEVRDPLAVLPEIAATIVTSLRVPYAAVQVAGDDGNVATVAERGRWSGPPQRFPMVAHGQPVGELLVAPRRPGTAFVAAETRLLHDLAAQAALAAEACRSAVALQAARDRLVLAREEERRRLRRDLHDGVASALVGTRMLTEVVKRTVDSGPAGPLLDTLAADIDACTAEVRELIDGLRPAALDDGLQPALVALTERFGGQGPSISLEVEDGLSDLPAAVEVAAYRVVTEALTNVVKHAGASTATVVVRRDERHLEVRVRDDGVGMGAPSGPGVGLVSMRSRAEELGGSAEVTSGPDGTGVLLLLPLSA